METTDFAVACSASGKPVDVSARLYHAEAQHPAWLILAHGAGAGHDSAFMVEYAAALAALGVTTVTFNFPYTERGRRLGDPPAVLESCWKAVIASVRGRAGNAVTLVAGGKSMGGRIASQVAADATAAHDLSGLVFLGYPLHPPGAATQRRTSHWPKVHLPALFVQGSRDAFGSPEELRVELPRYGELADLFVVDGGDHSFKVPRSTGQDQHAVHAEVQSVIADWIARLPRNATSSAPASGR